MLKIEPVEIRITGDDAVDGFIRLKWNDDGVAEMSLSDDFYIDEATIEQLTLIIAEAFKELMR